MANREPIMNRARYALISLTLLVSCFLLPLAGAVAAGQPLDRFLEFPPLTRYVAHAPFNPAVFLAGVILAVLVFGWMATVFRRAGWRLIWPRARFPFPWWGRLGLVLTLTGWLLAWTRFAWFRPCQPYTFIPLWLGFILLLNGACQAVGGSSPLTDRPGRYLLLFPVSSLFWWYFEWLNRFVQNWYYLGVEDFSRPAYILHASLCFSTVLPAFAAMEALVTRLFSQPDRETTTPPASALTLFHSRPAGLFLLSFTTAAMFFLARWPDLLFPFVWTGPLLVIAGLRLIGGGSILPRRLQGPALFLPPLAGLACGFFWELWNAHSLAHWQYAIPWVDRYHLFAMPILGYLGYLPFGLECWLLTRSCPGLDVHARGHRQASR